jgi:hypothetical protein
MVEFMVLAAPRSGTTWVSNWLTTDNTLCLHDPLWTYHYSDLDNIKTNKVLGVACTGLYMFPDFVNNHPARKIILHRDEKEINDSLNAIGLPSLSNTERDLNKIVGWHRHWQQIFTAPKTIYEYLTGLEFDKERHALLKEIEMQPNFEGLKIGKEVTRKLINELQEIAKNV